MKMSYKMKVVTGFAAGFLILLGVGIASFRSALRADRDAVWVSHTHVVLENLADLRLFLSRAESSRRGYVLTQDVDFLQSYEQARADLDAVLIALGSLTADKSAQQQRLATLRPLVSQRLSLLRQSMDLLQAGVSDSSRQVDLTHNGRQVMQQIDAEIAAMERTEHQLLEVRSGFAHKNARDTQWIIILGSVIAIALLTASGLLYSRQATRAAYAETKARKLLEAAPDAIVVADSQGKIVLANRKTELLFGYSSAELLGEPVEKLIPVPYRDSHPKHRADYNPAPSAGPMGTGITLLGLRRDATEFPIEVSLSPIETEEGLLVASAIRDVTARQQAEEALKESEARLKLALESAQMGAWDLDIVNDTSVRSLRHDQIFGYSSAVPVWGVSTFMQHVFPEDLETVKSRFAEAYKTGEFTMECRILWPDQSIHWISARGRVHRNGQGDPIRMMGVVADITERDRKSVV